MHWCNELPDKPGKYVVRTKTDFLEREIYMLATLYISDKGDKSWDFKNQTFQAYLKEDENN